MQWSRHLQCERWLEPAGLALRLVRVWAQPAVLELRGKGVWVQTCIHQFRIHRKPVTKPAYQRTHKPTHLHFQVGQPFRFGEEGQVLKLCGASALSAR